MLKEACKRVADETETVRTTIIEALSDSVPPKRSLFSVIKFSELDNSILSAEHYDTNYQIKRIITYLETPRSLDVMLNCFTSIVDTGKSTAFGQLVFNAEVKRLLCGLI